MIVLWITLFTFVYVVIGATVEATLNRTTIFPYDSIDTVCAVLWPIGIPFVVLRVLWIVAKKFNLR